MSLNISSMANQNFPFEIRDVDELINKQLTGEFKGCSRFIHVGPKNYIFPGKYAEEGPQFYNFKVRPDDVWVVTFPRSGTTFTQEMTWLLVNNLDYKKAKEILLDDRFPFLDFSTIIEPAMKDKLIRKNDSNPNQIQEVTRFGANILGMLNNMQERRCIKSHLPLSLLPPNLLISGAKVIYVARNPKDVSVSFYHLYELMEFFEYSGDFQQFWDYFENSFNIPVYGCLMLKFDFSSLDSILGALKGSMGQDTPDSIRKVADFLEKEVTDEEVTTLHEHLKFDNFLKNESVNYGFVDTVGILKEGAPGFVRKGKTGSWREMFNAELNERANKWIQENLKRYKIDFPDNCQLGD